MKQINIFGKTDEKDSKYTKKIEAPIYEPNNQKPHILELFDNKKSKRLIVQIKNSKLPENEKQFLIEAAKRHTIFNYEKIADYYAHSSKEMQNLMEKSALIIVDFEHAILNGYVALSNEMNQQYLTENEEQ